MKHLKELGSVFESYFAWSVYRKDFFGNLISAIVRSRSVNMQKVAENIEGKAKTQSNYRRIQRIFKDQLIDFDMTARLMSTILPEEEKWILTLDRTNWKLGVSNVNILVLAVAYKGMAVPLLWQFLEKEEGDKHTGEITTLGKRGNSDHKERESLLRDFMRLFGKERIGALTADREFIGKEWFEWLMHEDIPFVIRIRNNILLNQKEFDAKSVGELFSQVTPDAFVSFGKTSLFNQMLHLGGIRSTKAQEPLVLVSNRPMGEETLKTYQKRWEIETMFGAFKSKGFNFEESKIVGKEKVEKLMAFLSISFLWTIVAGDYRAKEEPITFKKKSAEDSISYQEPFQTWIGVAQERLGKYQNQKEGVFLVA